MSIENNNIPNNPQIEVLKPKCSGIFTNYIYKAIPLAFDESMSYYETLLGLLHYLKFTIIPTLNNNADAIVELQNLYIELHDYVEHYFDNLDVQEEINNKLDEMAESGQLTDIIAQYLGLAGMITFNTVAEMKLAENLVNGSKCATLGYHNISDKGNALYKIRTITNDDVVDESSIIALHDNTLIAELVKQNQMNPEMYGAYGDGIHDDTNYIQKCFDKNDNVIMPNTYLITNELSYNGHINGCGSGKIKTNSSNRINGAFIRSNTYLSIENMKFDCTSTVPFLIGDKSEIYNNAIHCDGGTLTISNCEFHNLYEKFVRVRGNAVNYVNIHDNLFSSDNKTNEFMSICIDLESIINTNAIINIQNNVLNGFEYDYVSEFDNDSNINTCGIYIANVNVKDIIIDSNTLDHLGKYGSISGNLGYSRLCAIDCYFNVTPLKLTNNKIVNSHWSALRLHCVNNAIIDSNIFTVARTCTEPLIIISDGYNSTGEQSVGCDNITFSNNQFINKHNLFEQGIFINSYTAPPLTQESGFYGHVDNLNLINNTIDFYCKHFFVFDYSLKKFNFIGNTINSDFSQEVGFVSCDVISIDTRNVMKTATNGKSFANTKITVSKNNIIINGVNIAVRTTDSDLVDIYKDLTLLINNNYLQNTNANTYVIYSTADQKLTLLNNTIYAGLGGVFNADKAYNNIVFYKTGSAGIYNPTTSQNNNEYNY